MWLSLTTTEASRLVQRVTTASSSVAAAALHSTVQREPPTLEVRPAPARRRVCEALLSTLRMPSLRRSVDAEGTTGEPSSMSPMPMPTPDFAEASTTMPPEDADGNTARHGATPSPGPL
eukprot:CAMPEP_0203910384 /NCGR_PEP_ID=MMETSP0359-20131031/51619_1 /ASSEMBLY_ACC=CAM_ASM_000338 /TAXON_ID=268821 /ORGANISM="Scrippsiella Hangoei, Strain SHTV-5" /LENGTH=118 /DNA_ID=CAMNT_0050835847 /DNA_START=374 /DNA_END=727 /DNA_ORIENTATION=+